MNIVYASDDNYADIAGVSLLSLFENNKDVDSINVFILDSGISEVNKENLVYVAHSYSREIEFIYMEDIERQIDTRLDTGRWSLAAFSRLFLDSILPKSIEKIIYIDCDTLILGSLLPLWTLNQGDYIVHGVLTIMNKMEMRVLFLDKHDICINSGVLLINMQKMREMNVEKKFVNYLKFMNGRIPAIDQGVINSVLKGYIGVVSPKYNFIFSRHSISRSIYKIDYEYLMKKTKIANYYDESVVKEANENPIVVHFMYGDKRPWVDGNIHPVFHEEYMLFRGMTPWAKFPLKKPKKINIIKKYIKKYLDILPKKVYVQYFTLRRFIFYIKLYIYSRIRTITSEIRIEDCRIVESRSEN